MADGLKVCSPLSNRYVFLTFVLRHYFRQFVSLEQLSEVVLSPKQTLFLPSFKQDTNISFHLQKKSLSFNFRDLFLNTSSSSKFFFTN